MDPSAAPNNDKKTKDGNWNFPPEVEFPVDARVKIYKVVGTGDDDEKGAQTKYLNTKVIKVETIFTISLAYCQQLKEIETSRNSLQRKAFKIQDSRFQ